MIVKGAGMKIDLTEWRRLSGFEGSPGRLAESGSDQDRLIKNVLDGDPGAADVLGAQWLRQGQGPRALARLLMREAGVSGEREGVHAKELGQIVADFIPHMRSERAKRIWKAAWRVLYKLRTVQAERDFLYLDA